MAEKDGKEDEAPPAVHPALKAIVFGFMASAIIWTVVVDYKEHLKELLGDHHLQWRSLLSHVAATMLLMICSIFLLLLAILYFVNAFEPFLRLWKSSSISSEDQLRPLLV
ncbi:unnamed protein product [Ilex paraguariensis]|uniref:Uncharacterized protein n=1 Tax=Ilex paraguariensis TaxID=185542 RepID=A0ABC8RM92_9AQUA